MLPEKRRELAQTLLSIVEKVSKEKGCLQASVYQDCEDENKILVAEEWATQEETDAYLESDLFKVVLGAACLMQRSPEIVIHTVNRSRPMEVRTSVPQGGDERR